jgi:hypothetical protein
MTGRAVCLFGACSRLNKAKIVFTFNIAIKLQKIIEINIQSIEIQLVTMQLHTGNYWHI